MPRITITAPEQNSQPYRFQLDREVVSLGRGSENDIVVDSGSVSTHHAEMRRVIGGYELHDLGSTNGTKLDGVRHPVVPLAHGSIAYLGDVSFEISLTDEEQAMLVQEAAAAGYGGYAAPVVEAPRSTQPIGQAASRAHTPRPVPQRQVIVMQQEEGGGLMMGVAMIILAVVAFGAGATIRHQKEVGKSLIQSINEKKINKAKQAAPAPTTEAPPAAPQAPVPPPVAPAMPAGPALPSSGGAKPDLPKP